MTNLQKITLRLSEVRTRLNEISVLEGEALTAEITAESDTLQTEYKELETRNRAAIVAEQDDTEIVENRRRGSPRTEVNLPRSRTSVTFFLPQSSIETPSGETAELQQHYGINSQSNTARNVAHKSRCRGTRSGHGSGL